MDISCIVFGTLFMALGALFAYGKIHTHIPAWETMPEEEKNKINIKALVRNIGGMIMFCGLIFLLKGFVAGFTGKWFVGAMILWLIAAGIDVRHISNSSRYQNN